MRWPRVVVGGEGAGRFGPPPPRPARQREQRQQRRYELAGVGPREVAPHGDVAVRERQHGEAVARCAERRERRLRGEPEGPPAVQGKLDRTRTARAAPSAEPRASRQIDRVVVGMAAFVGRHVDDRLRGRCPLEQAPHLAGDGRDVLHGVLIGQGQVDAGGGRQAERRERPGSFGDATAGGRQPARRRPEQRHLRAGVELAAQVAGAEDLVVVVGQQKEGKRCVWPGAASAGARAGGGCQSGIDR